MIDLEQRPQIPAYGSREHKEWLARRLSRNLRFKFWLEDRRHRPVEERRK